MKVGSLFAGIGGFDLGFERAGFHVAWCVEIDKNARAVLARRFPKARILDDVTKVDPHNLETVDVICGGFPCQDLSVAGKRAGLAGERSGLFHDAMRIVRTLRPRLLVLENVPGLLSSNRGLDFATVLREVGEGWNCEEVAWRVLDSQFFGVAQRRRRVFVVAVGHSRIGCAEEILSLSTSCGGNPPPRGKTREISTSDAEEGSGGCRIKWPAEVTATLDTQYAKKYGQNNQHVFGGASLFVPQAFGISEELTVADDLMPTIQRGGDGGRHEFIAQAFRKSKRAQNAEDDETWVDDGLANTLNGFDTGDTRTTHAIAFGISNQPTPKVGVDLIPSLDAKASGGGRLECVAFHPTQDPISSIESTHALGCGSRQGCATVAVAIPIQDGREMTKAQNGLGIGSNGDPSYTIDRTGSQSVATPMAVRRLTPVECERLQGFPDGWTDIGTLEKPTADSHRYKQLGNAVTVNVAEWIARRAHDALSKEAQ